MRKSVEVLKESIKGEVLLNEPLFKHCSFKIGGPAEVLVKPYDIYDLQTALSWAKRNKMPVFVMGNGTNVIFSDSGVADVVIKLSEGFSYLEFSGTEALVQAGFPIQGLLEEAMKRGLGGMEFAWGIPGAVGGSIVMNAGSNSHFVSTRVNYIDVMDLNGKVFQMKHDELKFDYRYSILQDEELILFDALFNFERRPPEEIGRERDLNLRMRRQKQPISYPCAGSVFKNPPTTYAGRVIEETGCKGLKVGDAQISELHANFIVNLGNATAFDVVSLIRKVQNRVYKQKDLILDLEVKLVGNFEGIELLKKK